jgi:coenzyme F420-0:L-glutamate ligase/coenzyme F420-1:gamma-L-glutamate ligase
VSAIELIGVEGLPEIKPGDQLPLQIFAALRQNGVAITAGDILVVTQKIISKAEGRLVYLGDVEPSAFAQTLAAERRADPRLIELVLRESRRIVRMNERVIISETHQGLICANAGIDQSNLEGEGYVTLLPVDPDASAQELRAELTRLLKTKVALIISDTFGRPWREGLINVGIGLAGINPLHDLRHQRDDYGKLLKATVLATVDEVAAAAGLVMRKTERTPVVVVKGVAYEAGEHTASELLRAKEHDLFR